MAVKYFEKAANQGLVQALVALGTCYQLGMGVTKDEKKAADYYMFAANI